MRHNKNRVKKNIRLFQPALGADEINLLEKAFQSGWIGLGPLTVEFENRFADYIGVSYAIALNSCTSALDLALRLLNIKRGDEVIVPAMTFVSTAHAVVYNHAKPVFADIDPITLHIDLHELKRKITKRTKGIIVVHYGGRPADIDAIKKICGTIPVIEDAAHACGAIYKGKRVGSLADMSCFSFHAVKNLPMGDGGALLLNRADWAKRAHRLRWLGIDKGTWDRAKDESKYLWDYDVEEIGFKYHMNDIHAAIGLAQLKKLDANNERRRVIARIYLKRLSRIKEITIPIKDDRDFISSWHLFAIRVPKYRDQLLHYLRDEGVSAGVHYKPIHLYPCYGQKVHLPTAEREFAKLLSLPLHLALKDSDVETVCDLIEKFFRK